MKKVPKILVYWLLAGIIWCCGYYSGHSIGYDAAYIEIIQSLKKDIKN